MANDLWQSPASTAYSTAANWSLAAVPVATNAVYFSQNAISVLSGLNQSAVALASFSADLSYTGVFGAANTYLQIGAALAYLGQPGITGGGSGSTKLDLDFGSSAVNVKIFGSYSQLVSGLAPTRLLGSGLTIGATGGLFCVAPLPTETATITAMTIGNTGNKPTAYLGMGVTLTALVMTAGSTVYSQSGITAPSVIVGDSNGSTANYNFNGTGAHTILTVNQNGTANYNGTGTIGTGTVYGKLDLSNGSGGVTVTNKLLLYAGCTVYDPLGRLTLSSGFQVVNGTLSDCKITMANARNFT